MKFEKYTILIVIMLSVLHGSGLKELEATLDEQITKKKFVSYGCAKRIFDAMKKNVEYFFPFVQSIPSYLINQTIVQTSVIFQHALHHIGISSPPISFHKRQLWSLERPYELECKPNRDPVLIHNMLVKFHPKEPHLLDHKESDFMHCITPAEQAIAYGGELILLDTSKIKATAVHNPSIIQHQDKTYMSLRVQGKSISSPSWYAETFLAEINNNFQIISYYSLINDNGKTNEDARLIMFKDDLYASYVTDVSYRCGYYNACMEIGQFVPGEQIDDPIRPNINDNLDKNSLQKNWLFFEKDKKFLVISTIDPMVVYDATDDLNNPVEIAKKKKVIEDWQFGQIRSSTTPIRIEEENKYLSFFHSHILTTNGIREYFLGALLFDNDFNITNYTKNPLFVSTPHLKRSVGANTILPYGCIRQGENLVLSVGINDKAAAIMKLPLKRIIAELSPKEN